MHVAKFATHRSSLRLVCSYPLQDQSPPHSDVLRQREVEAEEELALAMAMASEQAAAGSNVPQEIYLQPKTFFSR